MVFLRAASSLRSAVLGCGGLAFLLAMQASALAEPQQESGVLTISQADAAVWRSVSFSKPFTAPPVVLLGPASFNDAAPMTSRVRNVSATGFEMQIDEWDYLDGAHRGESISYLALEPGVHEIGGQTWEAGRASGVTKGLKTVKLEGRFATPPVIVAQVETAPNSQALVSRVRGVTRRTFQIRIQAQKADTSVLAPETVGYVAVTPGTGTIDGAPYLAGRTGNMISQTWKTVDFKSAYGNPTLLASTQRYDGGDPFAVRFRDLSGTGVELLVEEEQSRMKEKRRSTEDVGYLVIASPEAPAKLEVGSVARTQPDAASWQAVTFEETYTKPVVIMGPPSHADAEPITVRVRNVTATGFEFQVDGWAAASGAHAAETIGYLVMEEGIFTLGGRRWQAGRVTGVTDTALSKTFAMPFSATPVVLAQVATANQAQTLTDRLGGVTATGFTVRLQDEEAATLPNTAEEIHFVAIESGTGRFASNNIEFQAGTAANVTDQFTQAPFSGALIAPFFLADLQTLNDPDPAALRHRTLLMTGAEVKAEEETSASADTTHAGETVGFLAVAGAADSDRDGLPDDWETANGLDLNDATDADDNGDGDGLDNLAEYRAGTSPGSFDTGGTITVAVAVADGFEKEGTSARFRVERSGATIPVTVGFTTSGQAAAGDFVVKSAAGAVLSGSVQIPAGASFAEVVIEPVLDAVMEYPESINLTLAASTHYAIGTTNSGVVKINDATAIPENEQLFVAFLSAQDTAQTFASGLATLYLNGPKTAARVSLSFSGLTSNQTNAYIRYGLPGGVGLELRPTLPIGQVSNEPWNIIPAGIYTGQNIIDALFQLAGKYVYINVGTGTYPAGEITGIWTRQTGSTTFNPPDDPPALEALSGDELTREVARFLTQATFGPTRAEIDALAASIQSTHAGNRLAGFDAWIDQQFALDQTKLLDYTAAADAEEWQLRGGNPATPMNNNEPRHNNRRRGWWLLAAKAHDQLRQRAAFALSEVFVVSDKESEVRNRHYGAATYSDMLATFANGRYRDLLETVSKSPIMGKYLSHLKNQKAILDPVTGQVLVSPDENYAREVMQLLSIGLVHRHPDGTLKLGADGQPIATYGNDDIADLARVFTGWSFGKRNGAGPGYAVIDNTSFNQGNGPQYFQASWTHPMINFAAYHDTGAKTLLGTPIAAGLSGEADLAAALEILFNHPNTAPFISRLLIQRLVTSNPSAGYVYRVGQRFTNNGSGVRGDLKAVFKAILLDYEARSLEVTDNVGYGKQKEPIIRYVQLLRAFNASSQIPLSNLSAFGYPAAQLDNFPAGVTRLRYPTTDPRLGQTPLSSPTVFNWFLPDHTPGGEIAAAGLVAPEMQLTTETSVANAINYHYTLALVDAGQGVDALVGATNGSDDNVVLDRAPLVQIYDAEITAGRTVTEAVTKVLDHLDVLLLSGSLASRYATAATPNPRSIIIDGVAGMTVTSAGRIKELLYLVVTSPEYLHQR